jgi:hypothetical protein
MAKRGRRSVAVGKAGAKRGAPHEKRLAAIRAAVARHTSEMETPLRDAAQMMRVLELAVHAPDAEYQSIGFVAGEARGLLESVQEIWNGLRRDAGLDAVSSGG